MYIRDLMRHHVATLPAAYHLSTLVGARSANNRRRVLKCMFDSGAASQRLVELPPRN